MNPTPILYIFLVRPTKQKNQHRFLYINNFFFIVISYNRWNQGAPEDQYIIFYTSSQVLTDTSKGHTFTHTVNDWMHMAHCTWIGIITKRHNPSTPIFFFFIKTGLTKSLQCVVHYQIYFWKRGCECIISTFFLFFFFLIILILLYKIWNTRMSKFKKHCSFIITITTHTTYDIF